MSKLHRPNPVTARDLTPIDRTDDFSRVVEGILAGRRGRVTDSWATAEALVEALAHRLPRPPEDAPQPQRRAWKKAWEHANRGLLAPIEKGRIALYGAPRIGLIRALYPKKRAFCLPMLELHRLLRADKLYSEGVPMPVLGHALHPFWGTYVPTRTDHLELFGTWLSGYEGGRKYAIDVGTGSGVLAFMLAKAGFGAVLATDSNPNAVESVRRDVGRRPPPAVITPWLGDLLPAEGPHANLIVFNPPWLVGPVESPLDAALYTEDPHLVDRFVEAALPRLAPHGRLVVVFSNLIELVQPERAHPVRRLIEAGRVVEVDKLQRKARGAKKADGGRRRTRERVEVWVLAKPPPA